MRSYGTDRWQTYARRALLGYLVLLLVLTLMPNPGRGQAVSLRPGDDLDYGRGQLDFLVNVVLLLPLGALVRLAGPRPPSLPVLLLGTALLSCSIELAQWYGELGRQADVDDVIANTLGSGSASWSS